MLQYLHHFPFPQTNNDRLPYIASDEQVLATVYEVDI